MVRVLFLLSFVCCACVQGARPAEFPTSFTDLPTYYAEHREEILADHPPPLAERHFLLWDWLGLRKSADKHGITLTGAYDNDLQANVHGGQRRGFANASSFYFRADADLEKLLGLWRGLSLVFTCCYRSGQSLSGDFVGNIFPVATYFGGSTFFFDELYLKQKLRGDKDFIKVGRMVQAYDFATSALLDFYITIAVDTNPFSLYIDTTFNADPFASWGAYFQTEVRPNWLLKLGIYNGNLRALQNKYHGLNWTFSHPNGILYMAELDYSTDGRLEGNYCVGSYLVGGKQNRFQDPLVGVIHSNWGWYTVCDQQIWAQDDAYIALWGMCHLAPSGRNPIPAFFGAGIVTYGLIKSRPDDSLNFAYGRGWFSRDLSALQLREQLLGIIGPFGNLPQDWESVLELNYWLKITPWLYLTPVIQWVGNPGATHTKRDAIVIGIQVSTVL